MVVVVKEEVLSTVINKIRRLNFLRRFTNACDLFFIWDFLVGIFLFYKACMLVMYIKFLKI